MLRPRPIGTMIAYAYPRLELADEMDLAARIGASLLEILPNWSEYPSPQDVRLMSSDRGIAIHSAHGCWGGQTIKASRVDLGATAPAIHRESIDDLKRCIDWLEAAGGTYLIVHPGGHSLPIETDHRREALLRGLVELGLHASEGRTIICVENMPPGVWPGSRMSDLKALLDEIDHPKLALAIDTGHAQIAASPARETRAAATRLVTTHVHDNDGRRDQHLPPGEGIVDWQAWRKALDQIDYQGPILLECVRALREDPDRMGRRFFEILDLLTRAATST